MLTQISHKQIQNTLRILRICSGTITDVADKGGKPINARLLRHLAQNGNLLCQLGN
jgi:hypothetical protein